MPEIFYLSNLFFQVLLYVPATAKGNLNRWSVPEQT